MRDMTPRATFKEAEGTTYCPFFSCLTSSGVTYCLPR
jgi:hypothetical protein